MPAYKLTCRQLFPLAPEETFSFFQDPRNLAKITPRWLNFNVTTRGDLV